MSESLYASVLQLSRQDCHALRVTDPYSVHRVVYSLFPDVRSEIEKQASDSSGIQYADLGGDVRGRSILMLSNRPPATNVEGRYGEVRIQTVPENLLTHHSYRFTVTVNPTRRDNASKKLLPVKGNEEIRQWFMTRAQDSWGFAVSPQHLLVNRVDVLRFKDKVQRDVTLAQAHLTGILRVTDPETFRNSFASGIGRGRAFGCGLLQIVPLAE